MDDITGAAGQFAATLVTDALNDTKAVAPAGTTLATTQAADLQTRNVALVAAATTQALANTGALQTLVTTLAGAARTLNNAYADAAQAAADALAGAADALDDSWAANTLAMTQGGAGALTSLSGAIASGLSGWTPAAGTASPTGTSTVRVAGVSVAPPGGSGGSVLNAMPAASSAPAASNFSFTATYPDPGPSFGDVAGTVFDAALGFSNGVFTALNPFGFGLPIGPAFGHQEVFDGGNMVGWVTGWVGTLVGPGLVLKAAKGTVYACQVGKLVYGYGAVTNAVGAVRAAWTMYQNGQFDFFSVAQLGLSTIGFSSNLSKFFAQACFAAGTPIVTPEGSTPIEQLRVGDWVLSRPEDDPEAPAVPRRVLNVFHNFVPLLNLRVGGRTIRTTAEHPFWVRERGWVDAHQLLVGDELLGDDGRWLALEDVEGEQESASVYNVEVEEYHTYFVGNALWGFSVWAHNANYGAIGRFFSRLFGAVPKNNLRQLYTDEVTGLEKVAKDLLASGKSEAEIAQTLNQMRRALGIKYKEMTPPDLLEYIYRFNEARYGDKLGPTYEFLKQQLKTDAQIIEGASKPIGDMKQLGTALYKQFGEEIAPILRKYGMLD